MSNFRFLQKEYKELFEVCHDMERNYYTSPRILCSSGRLAVESIIKFVYKFNGWYIEKDKNINDLMKTKNFRDEFEEVEVEKLHMVRRFGNSASHDITSKITYEDAKNIINIVFNLALWFSHCYGELNEEISFDEKLIPKLQLIEIPENYFKNEEKTIEIIDKEIEKITLPMPKKENIKFKDTSMNEAKTRKWFIDTMLKFAGWEVENPKQVKLEYEVKGMPKETNESGTGYVDYVLWGENGLPLAVIEAKRVDREANVAQHQGFLYANCLEEQFGQRPVIFYSNGYETYILDDYNKAPERRIFGFYRRDELMSMIQRRSLKEPLSSALKKIDDSIIGRAYQKAAVTKTIEAFYENRRKALLVMATGSGKTRTSIAIVKALMDSQNVKRVLFLADRITLVEQARENFAKLMPNTTTSNVLEKIKDEERDLNARIIFSTYQTMMGLLGQKRFDTTEMFGVGHLDLLIVDESHRSLYNKYGLIFEYFDAFLLGLTATPKIEIDANTFRVFNLPNKQPTFSYDLDQAIKETYLVPPKGISIKLDLPSDGIVYSKLEDDKKKEYEDLFEDETGYLPESINGSKINDEIKNKDTIRKMLEKLMTSGHRVENGDKLGKTIIFTNRDDNAKLIVDIFNEMYPHLGHKFCQRITNKVEKNKNLITRFKAKEKFPQIAVSVDMLDTGVDIPEVLNLVFYRKVLSKTKFWQMVGRGTRKCDDVFGVGQHKKDFLIFDYFSNIEFFQAQSDVEEVEEVTRESMVQRIFNKQITLLKNLQHYDFQKDEGYKEFYNKLIDKTSENLNDINEESVYYKKEKEYIIKARDREYLTNLDEIRQQELKTHVSYIPFSKLLEDETSAKWFDSLILNLQLSKFEIINVNNDLNKCRKLGETLKENSSVKKIMDNIDKVLIMADPERLNSQNVLELEKLRIIIRELLEIIPKKYKEPIYTDFTDSIIKAEEIDLGFGKYDVYSKPQLKKFLLNNEDKIVIKKLKNNIPIDVEDFNELENLLFKSEISLTHFDLENSDTEVSNLYKDIKLMYGENPLTYFVRSLVGLEQEAVNKAFSSFLSTHTFNGTQIEFIELIKNNYVKDGVFTPKDLSSPKIKSVIPMGLKIFEMEELKELRKIIDDINATANPI